MTPWIEHKITSIARNTFIIGEFGGGIQEQIDIVAGPQLEIRLRWSCITTTFPTDIVDSYICDDDLTFFEEDVTNFLSVAPLLFELHHIISNLIVSSNKENEKVDTV